MHGKSADIECFVRVEVRRGEKWWTDSALWVVDPATVMDCG